MNTKKPLPPGKLWNGGKKKVRLELSFYGKCSCMNIGKDVIRVLGAPPFICLKINPGMDTIMIAPCPGTDVLSFKVPENIYFMHNVQMRITSRSFVIGLMIKNGMDLSCTYRISGSYLENSNVVLFRLANRQLYVPKQVPPPAPALRPAREQTPVLPPQT